MIRPSTTDGPGRAAAGFPWGDFGPALTGRSGFFSGTAGFAGDASGPTAAGGDGAVWGGAAGAWTGRGPVVGGVPPGTRRPAPLRATAVPRARIRIMTAAAE